MSSNHGNKGSCPACGSTMRSRKTPLFKSKYHECSNPACGAIYIVRPRELKP